MVRFFSILLCLSFFGCNSSTGQSGLGGDGGTSFDPCSANPSPGFDPVAKGLAKCCDTGAAHCVPADSVPTQVAGGLAMCPYNGGAGLCLPDPTILAGANFKPAKCNSLANFPGICLSLCVPKVANDPQVGLLPQDSCADNEVCVPCINPISMKSTGACEALMPHCGDGGTGTTDDGGTVTCPYVGPPIIDPSTLAPCGPACMGAHCLAATLVPAAQQSMLTACTTSNNMPGLCTPDALIASGGNFLPKSCSSVAGAEGRCISTCLPAVAMQAAQLPKDVCADGEKCAPCFNPIAADPTAPTGACTLSCDKPAQPPLMLTCPWKGPPITDPTSFPPCSPVCGGAHCVPVANVPVAEQALLTQCPGGFCTPDAFIATAGKLIPKSCTSIAGSEGRCLSTCIPQIAAQAAQLPKDVCGTDEKCAPCFNPTAADPTVATGACGIGCDQPQKPPTVLTCPWTGPAVVDPSTFPACSPACANAHCVPAANVPSSEQPLLAACPGGFCTPDPFIATAGKLIPKSCTSVAGSEGRCLSTCLLPVAKQEAQLPQDVCAADERCAPCFNPTATDPTAPTGACGVGCDAPKKPPTVLTCPWTGPPVVDPASFPNCSPACGGAHCVPAAQVPMAQQALLATCPGGFCAPDPIISTAGHYVPPTCTSIAGAEGRCMSTCLPPIAAQAAQLPQSSCAPGTKCAPCFNPTAMDPTAPTGACSLACDKPAQPPVILTCPWTGPAVVDPASFPDCSPACGGAHCVPAAQVPVAQQALLATCPGGFCAPDPIISTAGHYVPPTCTSVAGAEGRCMSTCLPPIAAQAALLPQSTCPSGTKCAPCFNPTAADPTAATGACSLACDKPTQPPLILVCPWNGPAVVDPTLFPACDNSCAGGHCLPASMVPPAQQGMLAACNNGTGFCTPDFVIQSDNHSTPPTCQPFPDAASEGRCLTTCLPSVAAQASQLRQNGCGAAELCVPCTQPLPWDNAASTGACTLACDAPVNQPYVFPGCCGGSNPPATCIPSYEVPSGQASSLNQDSCGGGYLCVPGEYIPNSPYPVQTCSTTFLNIRGACVNSCAVKGVPGILLTSGCPANHKCVPCFSAPAGTPGC